MAIDPTKPADNALVSTLPAYIREARAEVVSITDLENTYTDGVMSGHIAATDPHTQYVEPADLGSAAYQDTTAFDSAGTASSLVSALSTVYEPKNANIQSHISNTSDPHNTQFDQLGGTLTKLPFNTSLAAQTLSAGEIAWNPDERTFDMGINGVTLQAGQEIVAHVRNSTASLIANGTVCMATGTVGASGRITVSPMDGTNAGNAMYLLGIATEDIAAGADGFVTVFGKVRGIDTSAFVDGDVLYTSSASAGSLTNVAPTSGLKQPIAFVVNAHSNGVLFVRIETLDHNKFAPAASPTFTGLQTTGTPIATATGNNLNTPLAGGFYSASTLTDSTFDSTVVAIAKATATSTTTHFNYAGWFEAQNEAVTHTQGSLNGVFLAAVNNQTAGATPNIMRGLFGQAIHRGTSTVSNLLGATLSSSTTTTDYLGNTITPGAITTQTGTATTATNAGGASITNQYGVQITASNANSTSTAAGQQGAIVSQRGINLSVTTGAASKAGYVGLQDGIYLTYGTSTSSGCTATVNSGRGIHLVPSLLAGATINYLEGIRYTSPSAGTVTEEKAIIIAGATMLGTDSYSFYSQPSNGKFYNAGEATFGKSVTLTATTDNVELPSFVVTDTFQTLYTIPDGFVGTIMFIGQSSGLYGGSTMLHVSCPNGAYNAAYQVIAPAIGDVASYTFSFQLSGTNNRLLQVKHSVASQTIDCIMHITRYA